MKTPQNKQDCESLKQDKLNVYYKVKDLPYTETKDVDLTKRIVQVIPNTYLFFDSDWDVLLPGCCKKSIADRGPESNAVAKIQNVKDHVITQRIGVPKLLDERKVDGHEVLYAESKILSTTLGNDVLIEYQEGAILNHSIGFRYRDIEMLDESDEDWSKYISLLINPKDAEEVGFMFVVKEIELFEFSPVSFGANELTPYLGVKCKDKNSQLYKDGLILKAIERIDWLENQYHKGRQTDETLQDYKLQALQLKQIIRELINQNTEPSLKDTLIKERRTLNRDTQQPPIGVDFKQLLTNISK